MGLMQWQTSRDYPELPFRVYDTKKEAMGLKIGQHYSTRDYDHVVPLILNKRRYIPKEVRVVTSEKTVWLNLRHVLYHMSDFKKIMMDYAHIGYKKVYDEQIRRSRYERSELSHDHKFEMKSLVRKSKKQIRWEKSRETFQYQLDLYDKWYGMTEEEKRTWS